MQASVIKPLRKVFPDLLTEGNQQLWVILYGRSVIFQLTLKRSYTEMLVRNKFLQGRHVT